MAIMQSRKEVANFLVHRLVAATFLGQPPAADLLVNHMDGDRGSNHAHNLEHSTPSQNRQHGLSGADLVNTKARTAKPCKHG